MAYTTARFHSCFTYMCISWNTHLMLCWNLCFGWNLFPSSHLVTFTPEVHVFYFLNELLFLHKKYDSVSSVHSSVLFAAGRFNHSQIIVVEIWGRQLLTLSIFPLLMSAVVQFHHNWIKPTTNPTMHCISHDPLLPLTVTLCAPALSAPVYVSNRG